MGDTGQFLALITVLAGVTHEAAEHLFGGLLSGVKMYWAVIVTGVVVVFGAQVAAQYLPVLAPLMGLPWQAVVVGGVVTGFAATKLHGVLSKDSGVQDAALSGLMKDMVRAVIPEPGFPKLTDKNKQLLIDRYVKFEGLTVEQATKKIDDLFASLPG